MFGFERPFRKQKEQKIEELDPEDEPLEILNAQEWLEAHPPTEDEVEKAKKRAEEAERKRAEQSANIGQRVVKNHNMWDVRPAI